MGISPPAVLTKICEKTGEILEPFESVNIEVELDHVANIVENLNNRKGVMLNAEELADGRQMLTFRVPSRGLLGFRSYLTARRAELFSLNKAIWSTTQGLEKSRRRIKELLFQRQLESQPLML